MKPPSLMNKDCEVLGHVQVDGVVERGERVAWVKCNGGILRSKETLKKLWR
jgi:hypothetical protein